MKYKGEYEPSELLCPTALDWHPFKSSIEYMNRYKFTPLNPQVAKDFRTTLEVEKEKELQKMIEDIGQEMVDTGIKSLDKSANNSIINQSLIVTDDDNSHKETNRVNGNQTIDDSKTDFENDDMKKSEDIKKKISATKLSNELSPLDKMKNPIFKKFAPNFQFSPPSLTSCLPQQESSVEYHRIRTMHSYVASSVFEYFPRGKELEKVNDTENTFPNVKNSNGNKASTKQKITEREELSRVPLDFGGGKQTFLQCSLLHLYHQLTSSSKSFVTHQPCLT